MKPFVAFAPLFLVAAAPAQESRAAFDAPLVVGGTNTRFQALLDFDGDGHMDIVSSWWNNSTVDIATIGLWHNDGTGAFPLQLGVSHTLADNTVAYNSPVVGGRIDVDQNGLDDFWLAFHGPNSGEVVVYTSGGLSWPTRHPVLSWVGGRTTQPVFADFNGDGILDRALTEGSVLRIWTVEYSESTGWSAVQCTALDLGATPDHCFAIDANQDGTTDVAVNAGSTLFIVPVVNGVAGVPDVQWHGINTMPMPMAGDIDGDGDQDVVVFDMTQYVVVRRTGRSTFAVEAVAPGGPAAKLADVDGDGDLDGICCGGGGGPTPLHNDKLSTFLISLNDGTGAFASAFAMPGLGSDEIAGAADLDHDGDVELVAGRCIYYARGPIVGPCALPAPVADPAPRAAYDFDRDGDPDFNCGLGTLMRNLGDGTVTPFEPYLPAAPAGMTFAGPGYPGDFDGDGDVDLVVALLQNGSFVSMRLLLNNGGGGYADAGDAGPVGVDFRALPSGDWSPQASVVGDSDGDGDLDLFTRTLSGTSRLSRLWINDGSGRFVHQQDFPNEIIHFVGELGGASYGNHPDVFMSGSGATIHFGLGINSWMGPTGGVHFSTGTDNHTRRFVIEDLDGDGDNDLVYVYGGSSTQPQAYVEYQGGPGSGWNDTALLTNNDYQAGGSIDLVAADVNGDGWRDILISAPRHARTAVSIHLRNPGGVGFQQPILQTVYFESNGSVPPRYGAALDLDGDGDADFVADRWNVNRVFHGPEAGRRVQMNAGWPDAFGMTPTLGAKGPFRLGLPAELRVTGAPGAAAGVLTAAFAPDAAPAFPGTGMQEAQRMRITSTVAFTTSGSAAVPGSGAWTLPFTVPGYVAGRTVHYLVEIQDPLAPAGSVRTNALRITYGP